MSSDPGSSLYTSLSLLWMYETRCMYPSTTLDLLQKQHFTAKLLSPHSTPLKPLDLHNYSMKDGTHSCQIHVCVLAVWHERVGACVFECNSHEASLTVCLQIVLSDFIYGFVSNATFTPRQVNCKYKLLKHPHRPVRRKFLACFIKIT